jgi:hypothetical protein
MTTGMARSVANLSFKRLIELALKVATINSEVPPLLTNPHVAPEDVSLKYNNVKRVAIKTHQSLEEFRPC